MNHDKDILRSEDLDLFLTEWVAQARYLGVEDNLMHERYADTVDADRDGMANHIVALNTLANALLERLGGSVRLTMDELKATFANRIVCEDDGGSSVVFGFADMNEDVADKLREYEIIAA